MLTILFLINLMAGALIIARGRELRKKADPSLLTGAAREQVGDPEAYTRAVGTLEFAFGWIIIVLAGLMLTLGGWIPLLIGDVIVVIVYICAFKLLNKHYRT